MEEKLGKCPAEITQNDFYNNNLGGLLSNYYKNSPYNALLDAGMMAISGEEHMSDRSHFKAALRGQ